MTISIIENISKMLQEKGVSPSIQRIKILQFIFDNKHHSSVDSIYQELIHEIPTLSKTTVYNTLALFVENYSYRSFDFRRHIPAVELIR